MINFFKNKRSLITGGAGFIGSNLAIRLAELGAQVSVVDNFASLCGGNSFNLDSVKEKIYLIREDIFAADAFLAEGSFDYIFNLAGNISHLESMVHPLQDLAMNVTGQLNLLQSIHKFSPKAKIIYASTRQVYGKPRYLPVDEKHPIDPPDINGIHKFCAEEYHRIFHQVYGMKTVVLRLSNTYGPRQLIRHNRQGVTGAFLGNALRGEPLRLFGGGKQKRDFCHVDDIVEAFLLAASSNSCEGRIFNLAGEAASLEEFAQLLVKLDSGSQCVPVEFPSDRKAVDIGEFFATAQLFREVTDWAPKISLASGIEQTLEYYRKNLEHYL
jgi:UDP-glucose 4-epimerase